MTWRGATTFPDRIFAALPYTLPMIEALPFGISLIGQFPILGLILTPLLPFLSLYGTLNRVLFGYGSLVIFFGLFLLVVRNERVKHFIRFNAMQALLIAIAAMIVRILLELLSLPISFTGNLNPALSGNFLFTAMFSAIFLGVMAASIYSIVFAFLGKYGEIPVISDAAYSQVRY